MSTSSHIHNVTNECPACGCYLPTIGHLLSERDTVKNRITDGMQEWPMLFAIEARINLAGGLHIISDTYND